MKEFSDLRRQLNEGVEDLAEHVSVAHSTMPPNILILRRITVRQFPNQTMVALYHNDKLGLDFSIPYGGETESVVTPVALKEGFSYSTKHGFMRDSKVKKASKWMSAFEDHVVKAAPHHAGKISWDDAHFHHNQGTSAEDAAKKYVESHQDLKEEQLDELSKGMLGSYIRGAARNKDLLMVKSGTQRMVGNDKEAEKYQLKSFKRTKGIRIAAEKLVNENVIEQLRSIKQFHALKHIKHDDGSKTHVDPTTAHALLTVHDALKPEHQVKFVQHLQHSKPKFHKMLDFAWKQVK